MKIKSCPFCGGKAKLERLKKGRLDTLDSWGNPPLIHRGKEGWEIKCDNNRCEVRPRIFLENFSKNIIILIWNERYEGSEQ